ncbi:MAG: hypothetical protein HY301_20200 [Verrucomicrobia bacterium]|nr:hypothetical protein [Verrucomicrobiota bacterium]
MGALRYEEQLIVDFLKASPKQFFSTIEIARKAAGRKAFEDDPRWALPLLLRLRDQDYIAASPDGGFKYVSPEERDEKMKKARKKVDRQGA